MQISGIKTDKTVVEKLQKAEEILGFSKDCLSLVEKAELLCGLGVVREKLAASEELGRYIAALSPDQQVILASLVALDQLPSSFLEQGSSHQKERAALLESLVPTELFYEPLGGFLGYYVHFLRLLVQIGGAPETDLCLLGPEGVDLSKDQQRRAKAIKTAFERLEEVGEIYPVGGAGDRLSLIDEKTGIALPAARLRYDGVTLLEGLIRSLQAREYASFKKTGRQVTTPIALMTSVEKDNDRHVRSICEEAGWFGRPRDSFRFFEQPLVPVITEKGDFVMEAPFQMLLKPGGHGVIWKLALDKGVLSWFQEKKRKKLLVQQINNPIAGTDFGLLAFLGMGLEGDREFGFCSCRRLVGAAEGMNVITERPRSDGHRYALTNIEYTDLEHYGLQDVPQSVGSVYSAFPCNTNILFADVAAVAKEAAEYPVPGMLVNMKSVVEVEGESLRVGRLESTMQNIADRLWSESEERLEKGSLDSLRSYITFNVRSKTISTTKCLATSDSSLVGTPQGCYFDHLHNCAQLLAEHCHFVVPPCADEEGYETDGPSWIFRYHPALGPLFSTIAEKLRGGIIHSGAELELEIAEIEIVSLDLQGSLRVVAENVLGTPDENGVIHYGGGAGKARLHHVRVVNRGINRAMMRSRAEEGSPPPYWTGEIDRKESVEIIIRGNGEFVAENVTFTAGRRIIVPSGSRLTVREEDGDLCFSEERL